jgi:hypothetical protein
MSLAFDSVICSLIFHFAHTTVEDAISAVFFRDNLLRQSSNDKVKLDRVGNNYAGIYVNGIVEDLLL